MEEEKEEQSLGLVGGRLKRAGVKIGKEINKQSEREF